MDPLVFESFLHELEKISASNQSRTIPKSRAGRRPISVENLLKKDKAGELHKSAGLGDLLKTPIPGTKDWFVRTGKQGLTGALKTTGKATTRAAGSSTKGGVTSIGADELKRLGFGDLSKTGGALTGAYKSVADLKKVLQPGDILITRAVNPTLMSRAVSAVQGSEFGHSSLYAGNGKVIDTRMKEGVFETTLDEVHKEWGGGRDVRAYRPKATDDERKKAVATARSFIGTPYDKKGALRLLLPAAKNDHKGPTDHKAAILCSQLIVQAYPHLNFADEKSRDHVMPVDIANSPLTKRLGQLTFEKAAEEKHKLHGHMTFQGIPIAIENRKGSTREGVDPDGKPWKTTFDLPYGYIKKTEGKDGEEIDAYIGPQADATHAFVVHQRKIDGTGHDEDKVFLGLPSVAATRKAYLKHYNKVGLKLLGEITTISIADLKKKLEEKRKHTKLAAMETGGESSLGVSDPVVGGVPGRKTDKLPTAEGTKAAEVDVSNTTLYGDKAVQRLPGKKGDVPDRDAAADSNKLAAPLFGGSLNVRKGDVPSRDGNSVDAGKVTKQDIGDQPTTIPAGGTQYSSQTGAMSR